MSNLPMLATYTANQILDFITNNKYIQTQMQTEKLCNE